MEADVYGVNYDDTIYELKLKMQQTLDYAPNRLVIWHIDQYTGNFKFIFSPFKVESFTRQYSS